MRHRERWIPGGGTGIRRNRWCGVNHCRSLGEKLGRTVFGTSCTALSSATRSGIAAGSGDSWSPNSSGINQPRQLHVLQRNNR
jgi:hypothetical protein